MNMPKYKSTAGDRYLAWIVSPPQSPAWWRWDVPAGSSTTCVCSRHAPRQRPLQIARRSNATEEQVRDRESACSSIVEACMERTKSSNRVSGSLALISERAWPPLSFPTPAPHPPPFSWPFLQTCTLPDASFTSFIPPKPQLPTPNTLLSSTLLFPSPSIPFTTLATVNYSLGVEDLSRERTVLLTTTTRNFKPSSSPPRPFSRLSTGNPIFRNSTPHNIHWNSPSHTSKY